MLYVERAFMHQSGRIQRNVCTLLKRNTIIYIYALQIWNYFSTYLVSKAKNILGQLQIVTYQRIWGASVGGICTLNFNPP